MARKPRLEYPGAFYHVIARGNQKQKIFHREADFRKYLTLLSLYRNRYSFTLYAYTLMENHVHLLLETGEVPLSKILQGLQQSYTGYYNRRYQTIGHLFQGRYKAILCHRDAYLLELVRYIHLNPVRAKIVKDPKDYPWSSHRAYLGLYLNDPVETELVLWTFSENKSRARRKYEAFTLEALGEGRQEQYYRAVDQRVLGDEAFVEKVQRKTQKAVESRRLPSGIRLPDLARAVQGVTGIEPRDLRGRSQALPIAQARRLFVLLAHRYGIKGKDVAGYIQRDPALVSRYLKEAPEWEQKVRKAERALQSIKI
ncbi:MAG: transposase [candidate division NC10 bacterium]|nr:transposase [candidate division NC10 bacterium]